MPRWIKKGIEATSNYIVSRIEIFSDPILGMCIGIGESLCGKTLYTEDFFEEAQMLDIMALNAGYLLEEPLFNGADSAKDILCEKLKESDPSLIDSIQSLAGVSGITESTKAHVVGVASYVCGKAIDRKALKIIKEACANLLYCS